MNNKNLEDIRSKIDTIDDQIVGNLIRRQKLVRELLPYKNKLIDRRREKEILTRLKYKAGLGDFNKKSLNLYIT